MIVGPPDATGVCYPTLEAEAVGALSADEAEAALAAVTLQPECDPTPKAVAAHSSEEAALSADDAKAALAAMTPRPECNPSPHAVAAYNAAVEALDAGDAEAAIFAANDAVKLQPEWPLAWSIRAKALNDFRLFADMLASVLFLQFIGASYQPEADRARASLQALFAQLPGFMERTAGSDSDDRLAAWSELQEADPTSLQGRAAVYNEWLHDAQRLREAEVALAKSGGTADEGNGMDSYAVARHTLTCLQECAAEAGEFRASELYKPPPVAALAKGGVSLLQFLQIRRPNVPLAAYGLGGMERVEADIELKIGLAIELGSDPSVHSDACAHYERSASLVGSTRVYTLWAAATALDSSLPSHERTAAVLKVHELAVAAGIWKVVEQRPSFLIPGLTASAWHDPQSFPACRMLEAEFPRIREEALSLLQQDSDSEAPTLFRSHDSTVLAGGDWCDVGLYYNGMRNDQNAQRAPQTSALLCSDSGGFRRDCTSCSLGSAYFSLLRPHTRLAAHCGPTNARLRAHLGIVVPQGDCEMTVGGETRRWAEGKVMLFDDSFEHQVHNETEEARLVLIVDLWHPELDTDEKRLAALQHDEQRQTYRGVVDRSFYETTTLRGH
ncbi:hypothetical protein CYMTET_50263 [Cymbomonas tetramitiformis]|uniref:Aspartyl/asparaginy/proline hydroxylase domain-containing protein n=1 Tax=Cymbomonas tetramitiformis TaxID=36881 RepID=A0AAE0BQE2_9CHLO|nr:hypothetical protein CYMTET_50263 [Cymbomonas tetramitiformis]